MEVRIGFLDPGEGNGSGIRIEATGKSIGRTGIEMEVLTAVTVSALTLYDLLKPVDDHLGISGIRLVEKTGGKSSRKKTFSVSPSWLILADQFSKYSLDTVNSKPVRNYQPGTWGRMTT